MTIKTQSETNKRVLDCDAKYNHLDEKVCNRVIVPPDDYGELKKKDLVLISIGFILFFIIKIDALYTMEQLHVSY